MSSEIRSRHAGQALLLGTISFAALSPCAGPSVAADYTVFNSTGVTLNVASGETIAAGTYGAVSTLSASSTLILQSGVTLDLTNAGAISGRIVSGAETFTVDNSGEINSSITGYTGTVANSGTIDATQDASDNPTTVRYRDGIYFRGDGAITNQTGGTIVDGGFVSAVFVIHTEGAGTVTNRGVIQSRDGGIGIGFGRGGTVTNEVGATISGGLYNAGTNPLAINISNGAGTVMNAGTINGDVNMSRGGTLANVAGATVNGAVFATRSRNFFYEPTFTLYSVRVGDGTVTNSGMISSAQSYAVLTSNVVNNQGGTIIGTRDDGVWILGSETGAPDALTNAGTISGKISGVLMRPIIAGISNDGLFLPIGGGYVHSATVNEATGRITGGSFGINAVYGSSLESFTNRGIIEATNTTGTGMIFESLVAGGTFVNSGKITGGTDSLAVPTFNSLFNLLSDEGLAAPPAGSGFVFGYDEANDISTEFSNETGGIISGGFTGVMAVGNTFSEAVKGTLNTDGGPDLVALSNAFAPASRLNILNTGDIAATTAGPGALIFGSATITNGVGGTITGKQIQTDSGPETLAVIIAGNGQVNNAGTINGGILIGSSGGISNTGAIDGRVIVGHGNVDNSGTLALGATYGVSEINGNFANTASGTLVVKVDEMNNFDSLKITGTAALAGTLSVAAPDGAWSVSHDYTIVSADGGVTGTFSTTNVNQAYLTPELNYGATTVQLTLSRRSDDIQVDIIGATSAQQVSTSTRHVGQTLGARIDQAISSGFLASPGSMGSVSTVSGEASGESTTGSWDMWANFTPTFLEQRLVLPGQNSPQKVTGHSLSFMAGLDRSLGARVIAGAFFNYEASRYDIANQAGERKGEGPMLGAYAGVLLAEWAYASININHAWLSNTLSEQSFGAPVPVTGDFNSKRFTGGIGVTAHRKLEAVNLAAKAAYSYSRETFDSYVASDSTPVSPDRARVSRVSLGSEISGTNSEVTPYASAVYEWDIETTGIGDKSGAVLGAGLRYVRGLATFDLSGSAQVARSQERAYTIGLNLRLAF